MCGIAGLIHRGKSANIGEEMTAMLQALKHRGPDSTGFALYGNPSNGKHVMRFKVAEQEDVSKGFDIHQQMRDRKALVDKRLAEMGAKVEHEDEATEYAHRYVFDYSGDLRRLADYIEDIEAVEILSLGHALELVKDLGDATVVSEQYKLGDFPGTHAIGHTRMATESDVDIRSAHPYWAYPFQRCFRGPQRSAHQLLGRPARAGAARPPLHVELRLGADRRLHRRLAMDRGKSLEEAMEASINELDGVFTYLVATSDKLGMAKDTMAAKPMVLYESDDFIALASEEVSIRSVFPHEIDTFDPYEGEVRVWQS